MTCTWCGPLHLVGGTQYACQKYLAALKIELPERIFENAAETDGIPYLKKIVCIASCTLHKDSASVSIEKCFIHVWRLSPFDQFSPSLACSNMPHCILEFSGVAFCAITIQALPAAAG